MPLLGFPVFCSSSSIVLNRYFHILVNSLTIRHFHMSHNPFRVGGQPVEEMYGIMTKISSVSSQNQLLMLKNAPEFTKIMIGEICTSL